VRLSLRQHRFHRLGGGVLHVSKDVRVGVEGDGCGGVPEHLGDQLQLLAVLEHECGKGVPKVVESDIRQACALEERLVGAAVEVVAAHDGADSGREDESQVTPESRITQALFALPEAVLFEGLDGDREQFQSPAGGGLGLLGNPYAALRIVMR
jgi:hypothetical protein